MNKEKQANKVASPCPTSSGRAKLLRKHIQIAIVPGMHLAPPYIPTLSKP